MDALSQPFGSPEPPNDFERRAASRPAGRPLLLQDWGRLLFLHWPMPAELLRPLVPRRLEIDVRDGRAWVTVSPFTMWGMRARLLPPLPGLSRTHELNVRTYVRLDGVPGVWFFSLDASNPFAVWGARLGFHLPYVHARMALRVTGDTVRFSSRRRTGPPASFEANWRLGEHRPPAAAGSLDAFLIERYAMYAASGGRLYRARIDHRPWPLREARVERLQSTMLQSHGLPEPTEPPVVHAQAEPIRVEIWRPRVV